MKQHLLLFVLFLSSLGFTQAQLFSDDFESYNANAFIAQSSTVWKTWSNAPGGTEDARVSTDFASSGTKSLKLASSSTSGGPTDIILPFGAKFTSGTFTYGMKMYVGPGTGAYFNIQANATPGQVWAMDVYLRPTGLFEVITGSITQASVPFTHGQWLDILCVFDLSNNVWKITLDGEEIASFSNTNNSVASINLYPVNPSGTSLYYVDDVFFDHVPFVQPGLDLALYAAQTKSKSIAGATQPLAVTLRNLGLTTIQSVDVQWTNGADTYIDTLTGLNLLTGQDYTITHSENILVQEGNAQVDVTILNINGGVDENATNDTRNLTITGVIPAPNKRVVAEEATGTWCGWCPRGAVFMDAMAHDYPGYFIPIAVHNSDPMVVAAYDAGVGSFPGFTGYPNAVVDRRIVQDPSQMETSLFNYVVEAPVVALVNGASYDEISGELKVSVTADFNTAVGGNWRLNVVLTEDGVTGVGSAWNQANYYAGGGSGVMGGYELLPNPVPAASMVYDHVARAILGGFAGQAGSLPNPIALGSTHVYTFTWTVPATIKRENMHVISMLIQPDGRINNANTFTFDEAIANGLASSNEEPITLTSLDVYPNPANEMTTINLNLNDPQPVRLEVVNLLGQVVLHQTHGTLSGEQWINLSTADLTNGVYTLRIHTGDGFASRKLMVQH
ncbi:MAG: Omp28-related outer membrane protein [Saprospiraceae bacterium]|nr:Omp28-related outer membrane protein [Saprospiraceae bacterium]